VLQRSQLGGRAMQDRRCAACEPARVQGSSAALGSLPGPAVGRGAEGGFCRSLQLLPACCVPPAALWRGVWCLL